MFLKFLLVCLLSISAISCKSKLDTKESMSQSKEAKAKDAKKQAEISEIYGDSAKAGADKSSFYKYTTVNNKTVADRVFFDFDQSSINSEAEKVLAAQAEILRNNPDMEAEVGGYCDERGGRDYNLALGERRASAAKKVLIKLGANANQVKTHSYGKEKLLVLESSEQGHAQNRAAVTVFKKK
jgi:peptidoglycan-associated lipoprotein